MFVSYVVVEFGKKIFGELIDCYVFIFGVGKMGEFVL